MKKQYGAEVEWKPFFLHPEFPPEGTHLPPHIQEHFDEAHGRLQRMADALGLPLVRLEVFPNTRRALEASEYARAHSRHEEFHRIVFRKLWGEGQDIYKWSVLRDAAEEAGLDADEMQRETESGRYHSILDSELERALALCIQAVPTYIVNDRYSVVGAQPFAVFEDIIDRLAKEQA